MAIRIRKYQRKVKEQTPVVPQAQFPGVNREMFAENVPIQQANEANKWIQLAGSVATKLISRNLQRKEMQDKQEDDATYTNYLKRAEEKNFDETEIEYEVDGVKRMRPRGYLLQSGIDAEGMIDRADTDYKTFREDFITNAPDRKRAEASLLKMDKNYFTVQRPRIIKRQADEAQKQMVANSEVDNKQLNSDAYGLNTKDAVLSELSEKKEKLNTQADINGWSKEQAKVKYTEEMYSWFDNVRKGAIEVDSTGDLANELIALGEEELSGEDFDKLREQVKTDVAFKTKAAEKQLKATALAGNIQIIKSYFKGEQTLDNVSSLNKALLAGGMTPKLHDSLVLAIKAVNNPKKHYSAAVSEEKKVEIDNLIEDIYNIENLINQESALVNVLSKFSGGNINKDEEQIYLRAIVKFGNERKVIEDKEKADTETGKKVLNKLKMAGTAMQEFSDFGRMVIKSAKEMGLKTYTHMSTEYLKQVSGETSPEDAATKAIASELRRQMSNDEKDRIVEFELVDALDDMAIDEDESVPMNNDINRVLRQYLMKAGKPLDEASGIANTIIAEIEGAGSYQDYLRALDSSIKRNIPELGTKIPALLNLANEEDSISALPGDIKFRPKTEQDISEDFQYAVERVADQIFTATTGLTPEEGIQGQQDLQNVIGRAPLVAIAMTNPLTAVAYEAINQARNLTVSSIKGEEYSPKERTLISELIPEDKPVLRIGASVLEIIGEVAFVGAATNMAKQGTLISSIKEIVNKAGKAGVKIPKQPFSYEKIKNLAKGSTLEKEMARWLKVKLFKVQNIKKLAGAADDVADDLSKVSPPKAIGAGAPSAGTGVPATQPGLSSVAKVQPLTPGQEEIVLKTLTGQTDPIGIEGGKIVKMPGPRSVPKDQVAYTSEQVDKFKKIEDVVKDTWVAGGQLSEGTDPDNGRKIRAASSFGISEEGLTHRHLDTVWKKVQGNKQDLTQKQIETAKMLEEWYDEVQPYGKEIDDVGNELSESEATEVVQAIKAEEPVDQQALEQLSNAEWGEDLFPETKAGLEESGVAKGAALESKKVISGERLYLMRQEAEVYPDIDQFLLSMKDTDAPEQELIDIWSEVHKKPIKDLTGGGAAGGAVAPSKSPQGGGYGTVEFSEKASKVPVKETKKETVDSLAPTTEETSMIKEALKLVAPAHVSEASKEAAATVRKSLAELAHEDVMALEATKKAHASFTWMSKADTDKFIDNMENGQPQDNKKLQPIADSLRELLDDRLAAVQGLGKGHLQSFFENYFPHIWKDPKKAKDVIAQIMGKKKFEGSKGFLKKRTILTDKEGRDAGLERISDNPIDVVLLKLHEVDKYVSAHRMIKSLKDKNLVKFIYSKKKVPTGYTKVNDNAFTVYMPPEITVKEAYDSLVVEQLMDVGRTMGLDIKRFTTLGGTKWGYANLVSGKTRTKFASPESVLAHEIGHQVGARYGLYDLLRKAKEGVTKVHKKGKNIGKEYFVPAKDALAHRRMIDKEWRDLADARFEGVNASDGYRKYVRNSREKEAVLLEALIHAPKKFQKLAPTLYNGFSKFLNKHSELRPLLDIEPSLVLGQGEGKVKIPGLTILGHYYAPDDVARLLNNHLSPGMRSHENKLISGTYNLVRGAGNLINQVNLAFSAFHALNVSTDMMASTLGLGLTKLGSKGFFTSGLKDIASVAISPITTTWSGTKLKKAYRQQLDTIQDPKLKLMVESVIAAGGRDRLDAFYYNRQIRALQKTFSDIIRNKDIEKLLPIAKIPFNMFGAGLELAAKPIMEWYVPTGKMGLFSKLAEFEMERAERGEITDEQLRHRLISVWDSVDNRMGQLIYDNLFWQKTMKEGLMLAVRSTGWNLGSWREYAGAGVDLFTANSRMKDGEKFFSQKIAYAVGAGVVYSVLGATIQYILTGEKPRESKDLFFPRTGRINSDGSEERLSLPTYAKDIYSYSQQPVKTLQNKLHPLVGIIDDLAHNKDFYNTEISDESDPVMKQMFDKAYYITEASKSFSFRNYEKMQKKEDAPLKNRMVSILGIQPAPAYVVRSDAQKLMYRYIADKIPQGTRTKEEFAKSDYRKTLKNRIRKGEEIDMKEATEVLGQKSLNKVIKEAELPPFTASFKRLSLDEALNVYALTTEEEKAQSKDILWKKYNNKKDKTQEEIDLYIELMNDEQ